MVKYIQTVDYDYDLVVAKYAICASSPFEDESGMYLSKIK